MAIRKYLPIALVGVAHAQYGNVTSSPSSAPSTTTSSGPTTTLGLSVDDLWNLWVGPVATAAVNTTVAPTPVPSNELIPPPPLYYSPWIASQGPENPLVTTNESWSFPADFWWGVASAAYQVEGAVKDEGRGPSIWDVLMHRVTNYVADNSTGDVADNQYYLYKQDIARIAAIGVKSYSFSISWTRIFPFGSGAINEEGLKHYDDLIDTCIQFGIEPMITLFHWDTPLYVQNTYGGWLGDQIVDDFTAYAKVAFERWGSKVSKWFTVNEPSVFCSRYPLPVGYFTPSSIPDVQQNYVCGYNVLLAHASAYRLGKSMNISTISFKNNGGYKVQRTNSAEDALAVQRAWDFEEGRWADPIFLTGDWPRYLKEYVSTFLPEFTVEQKAMINGSADLFAHDAYTAQIYSAPDTGITDCLSNTSHPLFPTCYNLTYSFAPSDGGWDIGYTAYPQSGWLHIATDWIPKFLHYMQDTWHPAGGIAITEFGFAEPFESLKTSKADIQFDYARAGYYRQYMQAVLMALSEGVNIVGTLAWSLVDNLEWQTGYTARFGMQYVNFTSQERAYKASFFEYVNAFKMYQKQA